MAAKVSKMHKVSQRKMNRFGKAGESDRHIGTKMPKHLFAGKRKMGKTDRRWWPTPSLRSLLRADSSTQYSIECYIFVAFVSSWLFDSLYSPGLIMVWSLVWGNDSHLPSAILLPLVFRFK